MNPAAPMPRLAYLVSKYPGLSHAFIEREILALRREGVEIATFSIRPCPREELLSATMRAEAQATTVLLGSPVWLWLRAHLGLILRRPGAWLSTLTRALGTGELTPRARLWQVFYFAEAVLLHDALRRRGLRHLHVHFADVSADVARLVVHLGSHVDGPEAGWRWTMTMHGSNEFEAVARYDLAAKVASAAAVACISDFCRSQLMRQTPPRDWDKLSVVPMTVDVDRYHPAPDQVDGTAGAGEPERVEGELRLLYVGRLVPEKGLPLLLDALARLDAMGLPLRLRLVGAGPLHDELTRRAAERNLSDRVEFLGPVGQEDLPGLYRWADVFVLPSFQEGLPVVLMEALACGVPVVTTRVAGIPELVVDGVNGRLVTPGRTDELAAAIADLSTDPARRAEFGRRGRDAILAAHTPGVATSAMLATVLAPLPTTAARPAPA